MSNRLNPNRFSVILNESFEVKNEPAAMGSYIPDLQKRNYFGGVGRLSLTLAFGWNQKWP